MPSMTPCKLFLVSLILEHEALRGTPGRDLEFELLCLKVFLLPHVLVGGYLIHFFFYYETKSTFNFIFEKVLMVVKYTWHKLTTLSLIHI